MNLRGLEVEYKLELCRLFNRQILRATLDSDPEARGSKQRVKDASSRRVIIGHNAFFGNVFSEYPNDVSLYIRADVEQIGCNLLDRVAMRQELLLPDCRLAASFAGKSIHGSFANPTFDGFISVQHEKRERQSFAVMSDNFVTCQRHRTPLNFDIQSW